MKYIEIIYIPIVTHFLSDHNAGGNAPKKSLKTAKIHLLNKKEDST
mgnify:CR=1 FL=1|jgi:hypothetical protein